MQFCECPNCDGQEESDSSDVTETPTASSTCPTTATSAEYLDENPDFFHCVNNPWSDHSQEVEKEHKHHRPHLHKKKHRRHHHKCRKHRKSERTKVCHEMTIPEFSESVQSIEADRRQVCHHIQNKHHHSTHRQSKVETSPPSAKSHQRRETLPANFQIPLHVSVNLRFSHGEHVLLREDIFIPVNSSATLLHHFRAALNRHPSHVGRYTVVKNKSVVVVSSDKKTTHAKTTDTFTSITKLVPSRLIFTATPNLKVMRFLDERKTYKIPVNVRKTGSRKPLMESDVIIDAHGSATVAAMWESLRANTEHLEKLELVALQTVRLVDEVGIRFCPEDVVVDVAKSGGKRFLFVLEKSEASENHKHADHHEKYQEEENRKSLSATLRTMLGLNHDAHKHKKKTGRSSKKIS